MDPTRPHHPHQVLELPWNLLTDPQDFFNDAADDGSNLVIPDSEAPGGAGDMPDEAVGLSRGMEEEEPDGEVMDGVALSVETPLKDLRDLCSRQGISRNGSKYKVLKRLKQHYEVLERELAGQLAHKLFMEENRPADVPRAPRLPSARQQQLHNVTHQPFASWCAACVAGRSKASPHKAADQSKAELDPKDNPIPTVQIDYGYTFTKRRQEGDDPEDADDHEGADDEINYQDQFGVALFAADRELCEG